MKNEVTLTSQELFEKSQEAVHNFVRELKTRTENDGEKWSTIRELSETLTCQVFVLELNKVLFDDDTDDCLIECDEDIDTTDLDEEFN